MSSDPILRLGLSGGLPSPKIRGRRSAGATSWNNFLPAFSDDFAFSALHYLQEKSPGIVYDPFVGSGTSLLAAAKLGLKAIGNDLDPVSSLVSRAKICRLPNPVKVKRYLNKAETCRERAFSSSAQALFSRENQTYVSKVFERLEQATGIIGSELFSKMLSDRIGKYDSEVVALAAVILSAKLHAHIRRGSNPVWFRTSSSEMSKGGGNAHQLSIGLSKNIMESIDRIEFRNKSQIFVTNEDAASGGARRASISCVLTSPPYLNRLDYVVHHYPEISLLSGFAGFEPESIRRRMTGTTMMVSKDPIDPAVGEKCQKILQSILSHGSYASKNYYHHFYVNYFNDILGVFRNLRRQCKEGASGFMVIQNSYFKEMLIPLDQIFPEIAENCDFTITPYDVHDVRAHIGRMSPTQNKYVPNKKLQEWVLALSF